MKEWKPALAAEATVLEAGPYTFEFDCRGRWSGVSRGQSHVVALWYCIMILLKQLFGNLVILAEA